MFSEKIKKLISLFSRFPGVGPKTSARFVFYLLDEMEKEEANEIGRAIMELKGAVKRCRFCFRFFEPEEKSDLCPLCSNARRNREKLCVVEKETDLASIEKSGVYHGLYFILGGTVSDLDKKKIEKLRTSELFERLKKPGRFGVDTRFQEVILGLNPTLEGESTTRLLNRKLKEMKIKTTRLGRGLPRGGEVEYADRETLSSAFKNRS